MCVFTFSLFLKPRSKSQISNDQTTVIPIQTYILIIIDLFIEDGLIEVINYKTLNSELKNQIIKVLLLILILCTSGIIISSSPMEVTLSGIVMLVSPKQFLKALSMIITLMTASQV